MTWRLAVCVLAGLLSGCALLFDYPAPLEESGEAECHDGEDNDGDGRTDCYDPGCAAACVERCDDGVDNDGDGAIDCEEASAAACTDGVDNDMDARTDAADPGCWPFVPSTVSRCASLRGTTLDAPLDSLASARETLYDTGSTPTEERPPSLGFALGLTDTTLGTLAPLSGAWNGTTIDLLLEGDITLAFAPASQTGVGTPASAAAPFFTVSVRGDSLGLDLPGGGQRAGGFAERAGWQVLHLEARDGLVAASLAPLPGLGTGTDLHIDDLPAGGEAFPESRLLIAGPGRVSRLRVSIGTLDPCGAPVPGGLAASTFDVGHDLAVARGPGSRLCALAVACTDAAGLFATASTSDDGLVWSPPAVVVPASAVGIAWDEESARLRAVVTDPTTGRPSFYESADCVAWTQVTVTGLTETGRAYAPTMSSCDERAAVPLAATVSYVIRRGVHEVYWVNDGVSLARAQSLDGGLTFGPAERVLNVSRGYGPMLGVTGIGDDLVVTSLGDPSASELGVRLGLLTPPRHAAVPGGALLPPSGREGTFDREAVRAVTVIPPDAASTTAMLLVGAVGDFEPAPGRDRVVRFGAARVRFGESTEP